MFVFLKGDERAAEYITRVYRDAVKSEGRQGQFVNIDEYVPPMKEVEVEGKIYMVPDLSSPGSRVGRKIWFRLHNNGDKYGIFTLKKLYRCRRCGKVGTFDDLFQVCPADEKYNHSEEELGEKIFPANGGVTVGAEKISVPCCDCEVPMRDCKVMYRGELAIVVRNHDSGRIIGYFCSDEHRKQKYPVVHWPPQFDPRGGG